MPEATSGTGASDQDQSGAAGQGAAGADGAGASAGQQQQGQSAQDANLARENAKWRTQLRETQTQLATVQAQLEELKAKPAQSEGDASEFAKLKREFDELKTTLKTERETRVKVEENSKKEKLDGALVRAISEAKLLDPEIALIAIRERGKARISDDGKPVFVVKDEYGEEHEVLVSPEAIRTHKLVTERFFPAEGAAGSGSRGGSRGGSNASGVDFEKGLKDPAYFALHKDAMLAEARRRQQPA